MIFSAGGGVVEGHHGRWGQAQQQARDQEAAYNNLVEYSDL